MSMEMFFVIDAAAQRRLYYSPLTTRRCPCSLSDVTFVVVVEMAVLRHLLIVIVNIYILPNYRMINYDYMFN